MTALAARNPLKRLLQTDALLNDRSLAENYQDLLATVILSQTPSPIQPSINATATAQAETLSQLQSTVTAAASFSRSPSIPSDVGPNAVILDIPYRSQWDSDATFLNTDEGITVLSMLFNVAGISVTTDQLTSSLSENPVSGSEYNVN